MSRILSLRLLALALAALLLAAAAPPILIAARHLAPGEWLLTPLGAEVALRALDLPARAAWLAIGAALAALGLGALRLATRSLSAATMIELSTRPNRTLYRGARVLISERALLSMLAHAAEQIDGVREAAPAVSLKRAGWVVRCEVALWAGSDLPQRLHLVEQALRHALLQHTGIPVRAVSLSVHDLPIGAHARLIPEEVHHAPR